MMFDAVDFLYDYLAEATEFYIDLIRGDNPHAFTRTYKVTVNDLLLQMLSRRGNSQWSELMDFYGDQNKKLNITENGFYYARRKMNPDAVRMMSNEYIANIYDQHDDFFKTYKGCFVLGIDGSKIILPDTKENVRTFGKAQQGNQPIQGLLSTMHDCLNSLKLDVLVGTVFDSERDFASKHIQYFCDNYIGKAIFTFDRGYPSMKLIDQLIEAGQYFLFRIPSSFLSGYTKDMELGEDKVIDITFDSVSTNEYRKDRKFRTKMMNTTYRLRFTKIQIGENEDKSPKTELLVSNLPMDEFSTEELKEIYHLRWDIETSYNHLKNRMKMEEFSGYRPELILQDIYADAWIFNIVSLKIMQANIEEPIDQSNEIYTVKRNFNKALGIIKRLLVKALMSEDNDSRKKYTDQIDENIRANITRIKRNRTFERKGTVNKSKISYRKTY